jgi:ADP-ribosylglycohydrolase
MKDLARDILLGLAAGDAIGVPVEFKSRSELMRDPVVGVRAYGSHRQPAGTWSDDSSLAFCLAEMLCGSYDLNNLAGRFVNWKQHAYWTPHGEVFDIGIGTAAAIDRLGRGVAPVMAGGDGVDSNGNGSLMRILPLLFQVRNEKIDNRFLLTKEVSSLTHRHVRSVLACFIYLEIALELIEGKGRFDAYRKACDTVNRFLDETATCTMDERKNFDRILSGNIGKEFEAQIHSSGYVIHTLEASVWCLLNTDTYAEAVLKATNFGDDTDTTAAVTGGLAGLVYGWQTIPGEWLSVLACRKEIEDLADRLNKKFK